MPRFELSGLPTAVGSMPHTDPIEACSLVAKFLPEIPVWPQLPKRSFLENMYFQYRPPFLEGRNLTEEADGSIHINRSGDLSEDIEQVYTDYLEKDLDRYAMASDRAAGFHAFLEAKLSPLAVKGQVTGPVTWGLTVTDENRRPILYDDTLADALAKHLHMKAAWQEQELRAVSPNTIIFVDEPYMTSVGSAFVSISEEQVKGLLGEVFAGISGLKGIHCCGNTDWSMLLDTNLDILNFDAYNYSYTIALYPQEVKSFLERGGVIAWGIVAHDEQDLKGETVNSLIDRLEDGMGALDRKGVSFRLLVERCLVTPACGLESCSEEAAEWALECLAGVSKELRKRYIREE